MCNEPIYYLKSYNILSATPDYLMTKSINLDTINYVSTFYINLCSVLERSFATEEALSVGSGHY